MSASATQGGHKKCREIANNYRPELLPLAFLGKLGRLFQFSGRCREPGGSLLVVLLEQTNTTRHGANVVLRLQTHFTRTTFAVSGPATVARYWHKAVVPCQNNFKEFQTRAAAVGRPS